MIRKYVVVIAVVLAFILDTMVFNVIDLLGFRPDAMMALVVALAVLMGAAPAAAIGIGMELLIDILFNSGIGLNSLCMLLAALGGGMFYNKFYGDNVVVPTFTAAAAVFVKEHIMLLASVLEGRNMSGYILIFAAHILPSLLLTAGLCALTYLILKAVMIKPLWDSYDVDA